MKTMKDVIKATIPTTPVRVTWIIDDSPARPVCSNLYFHAHRAANRKRGRK